MNNKFQNSALFFSLRSPFARRVRLMLLEHDVSFVEKVVDVFNPSQELLEVNPLGRVPALKLASGKILVDSPLIVRSFYEAYPQSPLLNSSEDSYYWSGLATGLCDKLVEYFLETQRPLEKQDPEVKLELQQAQKRIMPKMESHLKTSKAYFFGNSLTQTDLDIGTALAYMSLRYSHDWESEFPKSFEYFQRLNQRLSFQKTAPPAA